MKINQLSQGPRGFQDWLRRLFRQPVFLFVTFWGHLAILPGAFAFEYFESATAMPPNFFSSYYWAISVATTVGSSDSQPHTIGGKVVAILMMVTGSLFLWSYTALFAASLVTPQMRRVGKEMHQIEGEVEALDKEIKIDKAHLQKLIEELAELNRSVRSGKEIK